MKLKKITQWRYLMEDNQNTNRQENLDLIASALADFRG